MYDNNESTLSSAPAEVSSAYGTPEIKPVEAVSKFEFKGNLIATPFPRLLCDLYLGNATGALLLKNAGIKKIIYFSEGRIVIIKSNQLSECLGTILTRESLITQRECDESIHRMHYSGRSQGETLLEMECLSHDCLKWGLRRQLEAKLFNVFSWEKGELLFDIVDTIPEPGISLDKSPATLIFQGIKWGYSLGRLRREMNEFGNDYPGYNENPFLSNQEIIINNDEKAFLGSINGQETFNQILLRSPLGDEPTLELLYGLLCSRILTIPSWRPVFDLNKTGKRNSLDSLTLSKWSSEVSHALSAESFFQKGEVLLRKRKFNQAKQSFNQAISYNSNDGEFFSYLGWTMFLSDPHEPDNVDEAIHHLKKGIELNPTGEQAHLFLGNISKYQGMISQARAYFLQALKFNPDSKEALEMLKELP